MKTSIFFRIILIILLFAGPVAFSQTLGTYPDVSVVAGQNTTVSPSAVPTGVSSIVASSNTNFTGLITVNPTTGVVQITNAKQAGVYTVTVKAFGASTVTAAFTLTVTNPSCSQATFTSNTNVPIIGDPSRIIAVGDFNGDGKHDIAAASSSFNYVSILLGDGTGGFTTNVKLNDIGSAKDMKVSDFNGDGNQDIAVVHSLYNHGVAAVSFHFGDGTGNFAPFTHIYGWTKLASLAVGDFNGDDKQDIAVSNGFNGVDILLGKGDGGFTYLYHVEINSGAFSVAVGDFNSDGKPDIAVTDFYDTVYICKGFGDGYFLPPSKVSVGKKPEMVAIGDFNGDGNQDFATANYDSGNVSIRLGNGKGGFTGTTDIPVGTNPNSVAIGDFNGDGKQDIAVTNTGSNNISILLGNGVGGFLYSPDVASSNPYSLAVGDFNGDGNQDIAAANYDDTNSVSIHMGVGNLAEINLQGNATTIADGDNTPTTSDYTNYGTVYSNTTLMRSFTIQNTGTGPLPIPAGAITLSGTDAALFTLGGITLPTTIAAGGSATFTLTFAPTTAGLKTAMVNIVNYDCDESLYNFAVQGTVLTPTFTLGTYPNVSVVAGKNTSVTPSEPPTGTRSFTVTASTHTNFTGVLTVDTNTGIVHITNAKQAGTYAVTVRILNTNVSSTFTLTVTNPLCSPGTFTATTNIETGGYYNNSMAIGDFNGDGKQDISTAVWDADKVTISLGDGLGGFTNSTDVGVGRRPTSVAIGDFNGDGKQDFITVSAFGSLSVRLGDGSGGFTNSTDVGVGISLSSVAVGDFNSDGKQDIVTTEASSYSRSIFILLGNGSGGFSNPTIVSAYWTDLSSVAIGDFNGDGKQDIAVSDHHDWVNILLGNGLGGFSSSYTIMGNDPNSIAIGDFNNDGNQDIIAANNNSNYARILFGDGTGSFPVYSWIEVGNSSTSVAIGDFNGDGNQDFVTTNTSSNFLSIRLGDGTGNFIGTTNLSFVTLRWAAVGDFNGDGIQDIASSSGDVKILLGNGSLARMNLQSNGSTIDDGDNTPDLSDHTDFGFVSVGNNLERSYTIQNTGTAPLTIPTGAITLTGTDASLFTLGGITLPTTIAAGGSVTFTITFAPTTTGLKMAMVNVENESCNGNPYNFIIQGGPRVTLGTYPNASVVAGQNTTVTPSVPPTLVSNITATTNTNFGGLLTVDATTGIVRITNAKQPGSYLVTVRVLNTNLTTTFTLTVTNPICSPGSFSTLSNVAVGAQPQSATIGDFNGDGKHDIATANFGSTTVSILLGNGTGGFSSNPVINVGTNPKSVDIGDFNGDGKQDIATANYNSNDISIRLGDGLGGFSSPSTAEINVGTNPRSIAIGDFNDDGKQDIVVANYGSNDVSILLGNGLGGFSVTSTVNSVNYPRSVAIGDFNDDGKQDIVVANYGSYNVSILLGNGAGGFSVTSTVYIDIYFPGSVSIGDFNEDGKQDLVVGADFINSVAILLGDGLGGFTVTRYLLVGTAPRSVAIGDFDGDNKQDIATANLNSNTVSVRFGDGTGNFMGSTDITLGTRPQTPIMGDFNGDGKQDLAVSNGGSNDVYILLGTGTRGNLAEINLQGNATTIVDGDKTPTASDHTYFGTINVNSNLVRTFTIQNTGTEPLSIPTGGITLTGPDSTLFTVGGIALPATITAGSSTTFTLTFAPNSMGLKVATVNITNNDCNESYYSFDVHGTATCNVGITSINLTQPTCTTPTGSAVVNSTGTTLEYSKDNTTWQANNTFSSLASGNYNFYVRLSSDMGCNATSTVQTINANPNLLNEINLQGNATSIADGDNTPSVSDYTDFSSINVGSNLVHTFTIQNIGTSPLNIPAGGITLTGTDASLFTIGGITLPATIAAAGSATFSLTFVPTTSGFKTAMVNIVNDDCDESLYDFAIQGIGCGGASLAITQSISGTTALYTADAITATNQITNATVEYRGTNSVTLLPGFKAESTVFKAQIGTGCPN